jgi:H+-transporting ATPase
MAVLGTQILATLIAVYGLFMTPLGWGWAGFVWGYALLWFLLNDRVKLLAYRIFDPVKAKSKPEARGEIEPEAEAAKPRAEAKVKTPSDLSPQIAKRAYELYEQQGRREGHAAQDWDQAERGIQKDETKAEPKLEAKATEPQPEVKSEPKPEAKGKTRPEAEAEPKPETKSAEPQPEAKAKPPSDVTPQLVKRVHEFYEELGREEVQAVQDWEKAERENRKGEPHK